MEDDPAAGGAAELWPVSVFYSQLLLLMFLNIQARKRTGKQLWNRKVCVCDPPSSVGGGEAGRGMRLMVSSLTQTAGSVQTICCVAAGPSVSSALAAFGLFSV